MRPQALQPGGAAMRGTGPEAAHEQKPHGHEETGTDGDGRQRGFQRQALEQGQMQFMRASEQTENNPPLRQQPRYAHEL